MPLTAIDMETAIEVAEHNKAWTGDTLTVFDSTVNDRYYGVKTIVFPAALTVGGWCARVTDGVGNGYSVHRDTRIDAVRDALTGYVEMMKRQHG